MAISVLRRKLEAHPNAPAVIVSVKGAGYVWNPAGQSVS
jgi:DNA-binding response OmpR family regulator